MTKKNLNYITERLWENTIQSLEVGEIPDGIKIQVLLLWNVSMINATQQKALVTSLVSQEAWEQDPHFLGVW
jgi:hypothetical protein